MGAIWSQLWRAVWNGLLITAVPFFLYAVTDFFLATGDLPKLQRGPYVWLYYWPTVFWQHGENLKDKDEIATFLINLCVYSVIAYVVARLRQKHVANGVPTNVVQ